MARQFTDFEVPDEDKIYYVGSIGCTGWTFLMKLVIMSPNSTLAMKYIRLIVSLDPTQINIRNEKGWTPLMLACKWTNILEDTECIQLFLDNGADVNCKCSKGETVLMKLISSNTDYDTFLKIVDCGADLNIRNQHGATILHLMCMSEYDNLYPMIELVLKNGVNVNEQDFHGKTPLFYFLARGNIDDEMILDLLLTFGADVNTQDINMISTITLLCDQNEEYFDVITKLHKHGANVNLASDSGQTALMMSSKWSPTLTTLLINCGADIEKTDDNNMTALHYSIMFSRIDCIKILMEHGADININPRTNSIIYHLIVKKQKYETVDYLMTVGLNPDNGGSILINLCRENEIHKIPMVTLTNLIRISDLSLRDKKGNTAYDYYLKIGTDISIMDMLNSVNITKSARNI